MKIDLHFGLKPTNKNSLLYIYYANVKELSQYNDYFMKQITNKLNKIGMTNVWREQLIQYRDFSKDDKLLRCIKTRLKDISSQIIVNTMEANEGN